MVRLGYVWLLAGLVSSVKLQDLTANMEIWDIDPNCQNHLDYLQHSFDEALRMAMAAHDNIKHVRLAKPSGSSSTSEARGWAHAFVNVRTVFGFKPSFQDETPKDDEAPDSGPQGRFYNDLLKIYSTVAETLAGNKANEDYKFIKGYTPWKDRAGAKPKITCGQNGFTWLGLDSSVPGRANNVPLRMYGDFKEKLDDVNIINKPKGAWYNDLRVFPKTSEKAPICRKGTLAITMPWRDMIHICDNMFDQDKKDLPSPTDIKDGIVDLDEDDDTIDDLADHLSITILHELTHWFGGLIEGKTLNDVDPDDIEYEYDDHQAVDSKGNLLTNDRGKPVLAYGFENIRWLAKILGPEKATRNSDSLAYFGFMSYIDEWSFAEDGAPGILPLNLEGALGSSPQE